MLLGALVPFHDTGGDPDTVREYAQALEATGYDFLEAPDHVLGANVASRPGWDPDRNTSQDLFHDPFVLLSYVSAVAPKLALSTGVLIMAQRQTALIAKQAACLDVLCKGRFRLGIGVGWNEVEFVGLNENFHNRGRRSEEQVAVMQALWKDEHVTSKASTTRSMTRVSILARHLGICLCGMADITKKRCRGSPNGEMAGSRTIFLQTRQR
jgi:alkanesulfonate monooxygenase SsuD/methylene tetrahydromethanopterin reductase-like flavin-dependent oxidoreductase (luciferase family)